MRPLELKAKLVYPTDLIEEDDEEYEDESGFNFMVIDADKKSLEHKQKEIDPLISNNDPGVVTSQHQLNLEKHPIARVPTLAAIEEQSITAALTKVEEDRPKISDIFPSQEPSEEPSSATVEEDQKRPAPKKPSNNRV